MPTYETLFIASPNLSEEEERVAVEALAQVVSDGGGAMVANERIGRRRLAYTIEKFSDGVYLRFLYDSDAAVPKELERRIRLSDKILRSLTVRLEPNWAEESKKQAVRDAQARVEAAEREKVRKEQEEAEGALREAAALALPPALPPQSEDEEDDDEDEDKNEE